MPALTLTRRVSVEDPAAVLALFPSLGTTTHMWDGVLTAISSRTPLDVLLFDLPGHGGAPAATEVDITASAIDASRQIADLAGDRPVIVAGVSMGGAIAIEIASLRSANVTAFASFNSALRFGTGEGFEAIIDQVRAAGTAAFDPDSTRAGWFTPAFTAGPESAVVDGMLRGLGETDAESYVACCRALADYDGTSAAGSLGDQHGLAVGGALDRATPVQGMRELAALTGARYAELPGAHLAVMEDPRRTASLLEHLIASAVDDSNIEENS